LLQALKDGDGVKWFEFCADVMNRMEDDYSFFTKVKFSGFQIFPFGLGDPSICVPNFIFHPHQEVG
jgi:hypothetical protein